MARTESKVLEVSPVLEQSTIDKFQMFGWELISTQAIDSSNNYLEEKDGKLYQVKNMQNYVKLAFSRSLTTPNLSEIKTLEQEYENLKVPIKPKMNSGFALGLIGAMLIFLFLLTRGINIPAVILSVMGMVITSGLLVLHYKVLYPKRKRHYDRMLNRKEEIERAVEELLEA